MGNLRSCQFYLCEILLGEITWNFFKGIQDLRMFSLLLHVNYKVVAEKADQLDSGQPTEIYRNNLARSSDEPIVFHLLIWIQSLVFFFRKQGLCHLWCSFLKPICGWQRLEKPCLLRIISLAHSRELLVNFFHDF